MAMTRDERRLWLDGLQQGDKVQMHAPFGVVQAIVESVNERHIVVAWETVDGGDVITWVYRNRNSLHRDTGNHPANRVFITPFDVLEQIGPLKSDRLVGGWEAA